MGELKERLRLCGFCISKAKCLHKFAAQIESITFSSRPNYSLLRSLLQSLLENNVQPQSKYGIFLPQVQGIKSADTAASGIGTGKSLKNRNQEIKKSFSEIKVV